MAQLVQKTSFSGGEIDPVLLERQNIQKVATGLEVARNVLIGKNALLEARKGNEFLVNAKVNSGVTKVFAVPYSDIVVEFTKDNIRIHKTDTGTYDDLVLTPNTLTDAIIPNLKFVYSNKFLRAYSSTFFKTKSPCLYIFGMSQFYVKVLALNDSLVNPTLTIPVNLGYFIQNALYRVSTNQDLHTASSVTQNITGTANEVEYAVTVVTEDGEESVSYLNLTTTSAAAQLKQPTTAGDYVEITVTTDTANLPYVTNAPLEYRFYRRPKLAGAFGYVGSCFEMIAIANGFKSTFRDLGQAADFSKNPPTYLINFDTTVFAPQTGLMYQGKMLYGNPIQISEEYIFASKTNFPWNLSRDYPLSDDSALLFKSGQSGVAEVLHMIDMGTLVVFTSVGIYTQMQRGAIVPSNAALTFVNSSVADVLVPPIKLGDLLVFYDGAVKSIDFSNQRQNYTVQDISDFSGHLFRDKRIVSWATVKKNNTDILFAVMDDGTVVSFSKNPTQELEAWVRHDFYGGKAITVCGDIANEKLLFVVERDGVRTLEYLGDEYLDSYVKKSLSVHGAIGWPIADLEWYFTALGPDVFAGDVRLDTTNPTTDYQTGFAVGKIYRLFDSNGDAYDLKCTSIPAPHQVIFENYQSNYDELPVELRTDPVIWETFTEITGLDHLNGKEVGVIVDGTTVASPLNNDMNLPILSPVAGTLTIPRAAYATVGLPYVCDIGTTDVKSPQDAKVALSSRLAGKAYTKTDGDSKLFYVGSYFPEDDTVTDMKRSDEMFNNTNKRNLKVRTYETVIPADWNNGARVCIRVVDPVAFRLLSMTIAVNIS
jgi:hypothetical protein